MFLKKFKIKHNLSLKSSDVKKLYQRVQKSFPEANLDALLTNKASVTQLKLILHNESQATVYCWDKLPAFFELDNEERLIPTVYTLWKVQSLLPYFTTTTPVVRRLNNGADLLLPGVIPVGKGLNMYGHYKKDQLVAVNLTTNLAAVGVGFLPRSSDDLYMCGGRGVAVKMLHIFGDNLWSLENSLIQQMPLFEPKNTLSSKDFPELCSSSSVVKTGNTKNNTENLTKPEVDSKEVQNDCESSIIDAVDEDGLQLANTMNSINLDECNPSSDDVGGQETEEKPAPEVLLKNAFLSALKKHGKSLQLPLLTSNFYRLYVVPEFEEVFDIKKSSYKKLSNFLNEMASQNFIVVREESKGIDKIISIDLKHPELVDFIAEYRTPGNSTVQQQQENTTDQNMALFRSEMVELYTITPETAPFFTVADYQLGQDITISEIKEALRKYIKEKRLKMITKKDVKVPEMRKRPTTVAEIVAASSTPSQQAATQTNYYELDVILSKICDNLSPSQDYADGTVILAQFGTIVSSILDKMQLTCKMCNNVKKSGNAPKQTKQPIKMWLATRRGNKTVTLVKGMEQYGIILSEFVKLCRKGAAANASVVTIPQENCEVFQVQGNQIRFIHKLLTETCKIPGHSITGLQFAPKEKKSKASKQK